MFPPHRLVLPSKANREATLRSDSQCGEQYVVPARILVGSWDQNTDKTGGTHLVPFCTHLQALGPLIQETLEEFGLSLGYYHPLAAVAHYCW